MKKEVLFLLHFLCILFVAQAGEPKFQWARRAGGPGADAANSIAVDDSGNTYTTGTFNQTIDLDKRMGTATLTSNGETDVFILKLNALGDFVWAVQIGGPFFEYASKIAIDNERNVYITGYFDSTVDFDPGPEVFNITSNGATDVYILKLDGAGKFIWAKTIGGKREDEGYGICTDLLGNAYVTGYFTDSVDLDPGKKVLNVFGQFSQVFVTKFNASGDLVWGKTFQGDYSSRGFSIKAGINGNVYINGDFNSNSDFDPGTGKYVMTAYNGNSFICMLDNSGNFGWAVQLDVILSSGNGSNIALDEWGNVYTTGFYDKTVDFDPGPGIYKLGGGAINYNDYAFVLKLDEAGRFGWAKSIGGYSGVSVQGYGIAIDRLGDVLLTGTFGEGSSFSPMVDFDPGPGKFEMSSNGYFNIYILKLDASGNFIWAKKMGGDAFYGDFGTSIAVDTFGNIYSCGSFRGKFDFDPGTGITEMEAEGQISDIYVHKMGTDVFDTAKYIQFSDTLLCKVVGVQLLNHSDTFIFKTFRFYFGDGDSFDFNSRQAFVQHAYQAPGKYKVTLKAFNKHLGWVSASNVVIVQPPLSAYFSLTKKTGCSGHPFVFTDSSFIPILNKDSFARHWWNYGDSSAFNWQSPYKAARRDVGHRYPQAGIYKVTQIVSNGYCRDTFTRINEVNILPSPKPGIIASPITGCTPLKVQISVKYNNSVDSTNWLCSNGYISTRSQQQTTSFIFKTNGNYKVFQTQYGITGCITKDTAFIEVFKGVDTAAVPEIIRATVVGQNEVFVNWFRIPFSSNYELYKNNELIALLTDTFYLDKQVNTGLKNYVYTIIATDFCGKKTSPSNIASTILLKANFDNLNKICVLRWNNYISWQNGVQYYQTIYSNNNNQIINNSLDSFFSDSKFLIDGLTKKCYKVFAFEKNGNNSQSESNEVCIPYETSIWIPSAITINGDGLNESLKIFTFGVKSFTLNIFNRWGEKVYESASIEDEWKPETHQQGIYMYTVKVSTNDGDFVTTGTITVLR